jgi:hypothetical protein
MNGARYRISAQHNNARAYRQFYGRESRTEGFDPLGARNRFWRAYAYAQALLQRRSASKL